MQKQYNIRLEEKLVEKLKAIAKKESKRTGYYISMRSVIEKVLTDYAKKQK